MTRAHVVALCALMSAGVLSAQDERAAPHLATRAQLEAARQHATQVADTATVDAVRSAALARREALDQRLREGDFAPGDRIALTVENAAELTDTFTVSPTRTLEFPGMPPLPVTGLLRVELERFLADTLTRYLRSPRIRARALMRVAVLGEVERPGYHLVPVDAAIPDVLMAAGGLTREARSDGTQILRGSEKVWEGERLRDAIRFGRTLDDMAIESGDQVIVPRHERVGKEGTVRIVSILVALPISICALTRAF